MIAKAEPLLAEARKRFEGKAILLGLYLNAGSERRWLEETEFKQLLELFVKCVNEGKTAGLRIFRAQDLLERPEYLTWTREILKGLRR